MSGPAVGERVRVVMTKWGGRPHWEYDATALGRDEHGTWLGVVPGTVLARPGLTLRAETDQVVLVPHEGGWVATFHAPGWRVATYVDITTAPRWETRDQVSTVTAVDLDLDVVRLGPDDDDRVFVDDEDEFAEHQVSLGYPSDVVAGAEASCAGVLDGVRERVAPHDDTTSAAWFARLAAGRTGGPGGPAR